MAPRAKPKQQGRSKGQKEALVGRSDSVGASQSIGPRPPNDEVFLRLARLEEECAEYKASFDRMKSVVRRLEKLEARCADRDRAETPAGRLGRLGKAAGLPDEAAGLDLGAGIEHQPDKYEIDLPDSIYSDFVLTWARGEAWPIFTSTLLCIACITMQVLFTAIVFDFSQDEVSDRVSSTSLWGAQFASIRNGKISNFTQGQYCNGTAWAWESDRIEMYLNYFEPHWIAALFNVFMSSGSLFCGLSLVLWSAHCVAEFRDNLHFMSLLSLPWRGDGVNYVYSQEDKEGVLVSLGWGPRIAVSLIATCRIVIILLLCCSGCRFLIYTTELLDFILNAVALTFIADIDDLCFKLISLDKQRVLKTLAPPVMLGRVAQGFHRITKGAEIICIMFVLFFTGVGLYEQYGFSMVIRQVGINLCPATFLDSIDERAQGLRLGRHMAITHQDASAILPMSEPSCMP